MATAALPGSFELERLSTECLHVVGGTSTAADLAPNGAEERAPRASGEVILRRGSVAQGRALEMLGHAVEYLVDSRMFHGGEQIQRDEQEALQILMRLSRAVFAECPEVISLRKRLKGWLSERLVRQARVA